MNKYVLMFENGNYVSRHNMSLDSMIGTNILQDAAVFDEDENFVPEGSGIKIGKVKVSTEIKVIIK